VEDTSRTTYALAALLSVAGTLAVTFWVLLHPPETVSCNTTLPDSTFKAALVPVHLAAASVLAGALWSLGARRALAAVAVYGLASVVYPPLFAPAVFAGVVVGPLLGVGGLLALGVRAALGRRVDGFSVRVLLWGALLLGIPASLSFAWMRGASIFCF
jgi:hypothetical protein